MPKNKVQFQRGTGLREFMNGCCRPPWASAAGRRWGHCLLWKTNTSARAPAARRTGRVGWLRSVHRKGPPNGIGRQFPVAAAAAISRTV